MEYHLRTSLCHNSDLRLVVSVSPSNLLFEDFDNISIFHFQRLRCVFIMYDRPLYEETFPDSGDSVTFAPSVDQFDQSRALLDGKVQLVLPIITNANSQPVCCLACWLAGIT